MITSERIKALASSLHPQIVGIRRYLHQHPELSFAEVKTGRFIRQQLEDLGIPHRHGIAENGVTGLIEGVDPTSRVVALRADFDALPIHEANDVPYKSQNEGVMHACGHDVHTASLLGTASILHELRHEFRGTVKLIFQPAEEKLPGGASIMIREGVLNNPRPASIFGQHVHPPLEAGQVGIKGGQFMASADELFMTVRGIGGHGGLPHQCIDPVVIAAHLITGLQQIVSRRANPSIPTVITFGKINSLGGANNIIPDEVKLLGTFRTMDEEWRFEAHRLMKQLAENTASAMGGSCELEILVGYPNLYNDEALTSRARQFAVEYLGEDNVVDLPIRMTAEDFAFYSQEMPACFYRLGTGNQAKGITSPVHSNTFDVDEKCLKIGMGLMAWLALGELNA